MKALETVAVVEPSRVSKDHHDGKVLQLLADFSIIFVRLIIGILQTD
jgi:hypothetical protein